MEPKEGRQEERKNRVISVEIKEPVRKKLPNKRTKTNRSRSCPEAGYLKHNFRENNFSFKSG